MEPLVYMTPKQPFFVTASESYIKYVMNRFGIVHFYQCRTGKEPRYAVPDGCVDMVFCCNPSHPSADICDTTDFRKQISAFMHSYMKIYRRVSPLENSNLLVLHSANQLFRTAGRVSIESLAEETGYTPRYLDRSFREETGLSPKQLAKIVRFQTAVSALNAPNGRNLTEIAMDLGYYDQSHFVHDFKAFTGLTPKKYEALLRADAYDQKLQILPANIPLYG